MKTPTYVAEKSKYGSLDIYIVRDTTTNTVHTAWGTYADAHRAAYDLNRYLALGAHLNKSNVIKFPKPYLVKSNRNDGNDCA